MRVFNLKELTEKEGGEYVLGSRDTGTHATYMIYGYLNPGEGDRLLKPGEGHEEIIFAINGDFEVSGDINGILKEGTAFHLVGDISCYLKNGSEKVACYIASGGHSGSRH